MKNLFKGIIATLLLIIVSQSAVLAENGNYQSSSLNAAQVVGYFVMLMLVILIPAIKGSHNRIASIKK